MVKVFTMALSVYCLFNDCCLVYILHGDSTLFYLINHVNVVYVYSTLTTIFFRIVDIYDVYQSIHFLLIHSVMHFRSITFNNKINKNAFNVHFV